MKKLCKNKLLPQLQTDIKCQISGNNQFGIFLYKIHVSYVLNKAIIMIGKFIWICKETIVATSRYCIAPYNDPLRKADNVFRWSRNLPFMNHQV